MFEILCKTLYIFELSYLKKKITNFFYIIYENLSIDILCLLTIFKQKYFFIKLKTVYEKKINNNLESNFLFNNKKLENSNVCLLINTNPRFEAVNLNLKLKQRVLKGNFKLISISSYLNLTFNLEIIGSTIKILKFLIEGRHFCCQILKHKNNFSIIINFELLKRKDNNFIYLMLLYLNKIINYYKINILNTSLYETGVNSINNNNNNNKLLFQYSSIYFLNISNLKNNNIINNILYVNLLYLTKINFLLTIKKNYLYNNSNLMFLNKKKLNKLTNYFYLPIKTLFENSELFINNEGLLKKSSQLFYNNKTLLKTNWKLLRNMFNKINKNLFILNNNFLINFNLKNRFNFIKIIYLLYLAKKIINNNLFINNINLFSIIENKLILFINKKVKLINTKIKFWLNDFFIEGRDTFSYNSLIMIKCSNINRLQYTNFF